MTTASTVGLAAGVAAVIFIDFGFTLEQAQRMIAAAYEIVQEKQEKPDAT